jgi:hypothetical protein
MLKWNMYAQIIYIFEKLLGRTIPVVNSISDVYVGTLCAQSRIKEKWGPVLVKSWALKGVDRVCLQRQKGMHAQ